MKGRVFYVGYCDIVNKGVLKNGGCVVLQNTGGVKSVQSFWHYQRQELFFYFLHLNERNLENFFKKWDQISQVNLQPKSLALIVYNIAKHIRQPSIDNGVRGRILSHLKQNIGLWEDVALRKRDGFNTRDFANSVWSLTALDSLYRKSNFAETFYKIRDFISLDKIKNLKDQKQIYDADLWFKGETALQNTPLSGVKSSLESNVKAAFFTAGYATPEIKKPLIPQLADAIDFSVVSRDSDHRVEVEVDGSYHFLNPEQAQHPSELVYNIQTYFRRALQTKIAPEEFSILCIDLLTAKKIQRIRNNPRAARRECRRLFEAAVGAGAGTNRTVGGSKIIVPFSYNNRF